jgi:putative transposase
LKHNKRDIAINRLALPKSKYYIQIPEYIKISQIKCIVAKQYYGKVKLNISYEKEVNVKNLNKNKYLGIDIGIDNIVAITTDNQTNKSWIVKGSKLKSINQFYNKQLSNYKSLLETNNKTKSSKRLHKINMKRQNIFDYEFHCLSKKIIQLCIENDIGNIVIGHNKNWKQNSKLGKKTNQTFVQIPFNNLIFKLQYKCEESGINCIISEESYTSKIDHLVNEDMKKQDSYLGKRIKRGLFKSSCGKILNADINGAIGILRKKNVFSDVDLINLRGRGDVVSPRLLKYGV